MKIIAYAAWDSEFNLVKFDTEAEAIEFCGDSDRVIPIIKTEEIVIEKEESDPGTIHEYDLGCGDYDTQDEDWQDDWNSPASCWHY